MLAISYKEATSKKGHAWHLRFKIDPWNPFNLLFTSIGAVEKNETHM